MTSALVDRIEHVKIHKLLNLKNDNFIFCATGGLKIGFLPFPNMLKITKTVGELVVVYLEGYLMDGKRL